ncbi:TetR/AcrR family transcriptional regulator [Acinetobacter sp. ANC 4635]|uniref:TetR/AcrR family transcriptional regulator n=1 Tax=Acinetobacter sp. ANC 4635 TaxID=2529846 RepID=UPI0013F168E6|nr:TetR/AcrR family transcriptional regulator [Acinetobacter sp. ANC 4635]
MAKVRSEVTRLAILQAAAQVFKISGFESTTMDAIRDQAQVSKATLYGYFPSKEELFVESLLYEAEAEFDRNLLFNPREIPELKSHLVALAQNMIRFAYSPNGLAIRRLLIASAKNPELGQRCYEHGPQKGKAEMRALLQQAINEGQLKPHDPTISECHLRALIEAEFVDILHFGLNLPLTEEWIQAASQRAISSFLTLYAS